jgi:hypothetical protein
MMASRIGGMQSHLFREWFLVRFDQYVVSSGQDINA